MKKVLLIIVLLFAFILIGCKSVYYNEIHNKSYNVEIDLEEFEDLITASIEKAAPSVVGVSNYEKGLLGYTLSSTASGVVYSCEAVMKDGTIEKDYTNTFDSNDVSEYRYKLITNRHVVTSKKENKIRIFIGDDGRKVDATILGIDDKVDLAVLEFAYPKFIQPISFGDSSKVQRGNFAIAIGHPGGYEYYGSSTFGIVSYPKRYLSSDTDGDGVDDWDSEYIQHDVAINSGSSGGALVNIRGELIGINTMKLVEEDTENMGFAIPSNLVKEIVSYLEKGLKPRRITLGITTYEVIKIINNDDNGSNVPSANIPSDIDYGLYIDEVDVMGMTFKSLQHGDIILKINDVKITRKQEFNAELGKVIDGSFKLLILRNSEEIEVWISY